MLMKTIEEGNKLIAEFMGGALDSTESKYYYFLSEGRYKMELKYHSNWNELMPVVEKIQITNQCDIIIHAKNIVEASYNKQTHKYYGGSLLQGTFFACVEFIEWYNNNQ